MSLVVRGYNCPAEHNNTETKIMSGTSSYVVDYFAGTKIFAYALNQCTANHVLGLAFFKYVCESSGSEWTVTKTQYPTADCNEEDGELVDTWYEGNTTYGTPGYFDCDGADNYVSVQISTFEDCVNLGQTIYGGLSGCLMNSPLLTNFYCDSDQAVVQFFRNASYLEDTATTDMAYGYCDSSLLCDTWNFGTEECTVIGKVSGFVLYGKMNKCMAEFTSNTNTDTDKSSPVFFSILTISFALFASLFQL
jgi:hypothetical protein